MSFKDSASFMPSYRHSNYSYRNCPDSSSSMTLTMAKGLQLGDHHANFS